MAAVSPARKQYEQSSAKEKTGETCGDLSTSSNFLKGWLVPAEKLTYVKKCKNDVPDWASLH